MLTFISRIPIFRRIFYAFLLAAVIPGIVITILGVYFLNSQNTRGQAFQISSNAVQDGATIAGYLQELKGQPTLAYQEWSQPKSGNQAAVGSRTIASVRGVLSRLESATNDYQKKDDIVSAQQMSVIRSLLLT